MRYAWTFLLSAILVTGFGKTNQLDQNWSAPIKFSQTKEGLAASFYVYKWNNTILVLRSADNVNGEYNCWSLTQDGMTWKNGVIEGFSEFDVTPIITDPATNRLVFVASTKSETEAKYVLRTVSLDEDDFRISNLSRQTIAVTPSLPAGEYVYGPVSGIGASVNSNYFVPYIIRTDARPGSSVKETPAVFPVGLFYSLDGGLSWKQTNVLRRAVWSADAGATAGALYLLGWQQGGYGGNLWFSKQALDRFSSAAEELNKTCVGGFSMANNDDTIHLCWMDCRHEQIPSQMAMFLFGADERRNYEIFYRHVTDSKKTWEPEILLSKGLRYAYTPSISAEGKKIVIAWAGVKKAAEKYHDDYCPNDIYYAVSKDNGDTWSKPMRVTDNIPRGMTAADPQVELLNNIIHLFYIEGKYQKKPEVSGLRLIQQPPYDIIYQQRPFPN